MANEKLKIYELLNESDVVINIIKKNGEPRKLIARNWKEVEKLHSGTALPTETETRQEDLVVVYDYIAQGWRSFHEDQIVDYRADPNVVDE